MEDERTLSMYLFIVLIFILIVLFMANQIPVDEKRIVISIRILLLSAAAIIGVFALLSYFGKWG